MEVAFIVTVSFCQVIHILLLQMAPWIYSAGIPPRDISGFDDYFPDDTADQSQSAPVSLVARISRVPHQASPAASLSMSAREAYFMEDSHVSELGNPNVFYIHSDRRSVIDSTGNQSPVPIYHSDDKMQVDPFSSNHVPMYHDPRWESVPEILNDMLFIGAWTNDPPEQSVKKPLPLDKKRDRRKQGKMQPATVRPVKRIIHDEN